MHLEAEDARTFHAFVIRQIVLMLCAGLVHGDLSEFNVLLGPDGPVIIDLPQAVDAAANNHAFNMLQRDVDNMAHYFGRFAPELKSTRYAQEMWALYEAGDLLPDSPLTGVFEDDEHEADVTGSFARSMLPAWMMPAAVPRGPRPSMDRPRQKSRRRPGFSNRLPVPASSRACPRRGRYRITRAPNSHCL